MTGGATVKDVSEKRTKAIEVFEDATFNLHKWHSNVSDLEGKEQSSHQTTTNNDEETTFAKQQLGTNQSEVKLLGLSWDKSQDTLRVVTVREDHATTKRGALSQLAKVYDPLGLVLPTTLPGKILYRDIFEANLAWDGEFPEELMKRWKDWYEHFPERYTVPRTLAS